MKKNSTLHCASRSGSRVPRGSSPKTSFSTTLLEFFYTKKILFLPSPRDYERIIAGHNDIKGGSFLLLLGLASLSLMVIEKKRNIIEGCSRPNPRLRSLKQIRLDLI